jgi:hypothetical protein
MKWVSFDDHTDAATGRIDWAAYNQAQRDNGERCRTCPAIILFPKGHPAQCGQCRRLETDRDEAVHEERLRCPKCRHAWCPEEQLDEGDAVGVDCPLCEHAFDVGVFYTATYTSPPLLPAEPEPDEEDEDEDESEGGDG